jgi:cobalt-zinc-cadmium efflux system outer membrane protein
MLIRNLLFNVLLISGLSLVAQAQAPLTLRQALQQVRTNSPALRIERLNINAAQADEVTANLRSNPTVNNQTLFQLNQGQPAVPGVDLPGMLSRQRRQFWLQATKEFDIYHKRDYRTRFAQASTKLAQQNVAETERTVLLDAANRFLDAWYARIQLVLLERARANTDTLVQLNRVRLKNLAISSTDLTRTRLLLDQYELQTRTAQQDLRNRLNELRLVLGTTDSVNVAMNDSIVNPAVPNPLVLHPVPLAPADSLLQLAATSRTDVGVAAATIEAAQRNLALQRVLAKPRNEAGLIWNPQNSVPYAGIFLTLELPFYNRNQGEIQKAQIVQDQASQAATFVQARIRTEVSTAYESFISSRRNVERYTGIRRDADQVLASVRYAYLRGATTLIDLFEAQRSWFETQTAYYEAVYTYRQNYIRLLYSTGQINTY